MKVRLSILLILFGFSGVVACKTRTTKSKATFESTSVNDWVYVLKDKSLPATALFEMKDGILSVSGLTSGYLRTKKAHKRFRLSVDWRWTKAPGNSGVLVHIQPGDTIWPVCYQVQQKVDAAGDIICMNGLWANECKDTLKSTVPKMKPSNEKPLGEWNTMRVESDNGILIVYINGELQNKVTGLTVQKGYIGFQGEGKPLEFRNLIIK